MDQLAQAATALLERPIRTLLSTVLVAASSALIVIVTALGTSASQQVSARFDALRATAVEIGVAGPTQGEAPAEGVARPLIEQFPLDARARLMALDGVTAAGVLLMRQTRAEVALAPAVLAASVTGVVGENLVLSDAGLADAAQLSVDGRWISESDERQGRRVAVVGDLVASRLGINSPRGVVLIDGLQYAVIGVVTSSPLRPELLDSVTIPRPGQPEYLGWGIADSSVVVARTAPGAAQTIADQAPMQLYPEAPSMFRSSAPPDPGEFRATLESDAQDIMRAFAAAGITLGILATCLVWWSTVGSRRGAIGLLRAVGATRTHIFRLILTECALGGLAAGAVGTCLGVMVVSGVCVFRGWQLVMPAYLPVLTVLATTVVGGAAGTIPAWAAARVDPVDSLRSG
jgi:putative ABC transport system permease protein